MGSIGNLGFITIAFQESFAVLSEQKRPREKRKKLWDIGETLNVRSDFKWTRFLQVA